MLATELGDDVIEVLLLAEALPFEHFHNVRNLSHMLETVASSKDMLSRLGRSVLMYCAITPCRRPLPTHFDQDYLVQVVATGLPLRCYKPPHRYPYCRRRT